MTAVTTTRDNHRGRKTIGSSSVLDGKRKEGRVEHGLVLGAPEHQRQVREGPAAADDLSQTQGGALNRTPGEREGACGEFNVCVRGRGGGGQTKGGWGGDKPP